MSIRTANLRYLLALTAPDRSVIVPQPTAESISALLMQGVERRLKGQGQ